MFFHLNNLKRSVQISLTVQMYISFVFKGRWGEWKRPSIYTSVKQRKILKWLCPPGKSKQNQLEDNSQSKIPQYKN